MSLFIKIRSSSGVDQLWHTDQIGPVPALYGLWTKNGFCTFKGLLKKKGEEKEFQQRPYVDVAHNA